MSRKAERSPMHHRTVPYGSLFRREPDTSDSFIDLNRMMTILMRRARLIALSVVVALALGVLYLVFATPLYTAMTQILLDEDLSRYAEEAETTPQSSQQADTRLASAIEILKSGRLMTMLPFDKRLKRKHWAVYGFMLDWYHRKYGNALASVRHIVAILKERDPDGVGFFVGDVHSALTDLVAWGYLEQEKGTGRRASRYIPTWSKFDSVRETPNTTEIDLAFGESQNTDVRETPNATGDSVRGTPNEDPSTGPGPS